MAEHNIYGKEGEDLAAAYLESQGYAILDRNWHAGHKELDLVARKDDTLVIVEVKTRDNDGYGNPEDAVDNKKIKKLISAADAYIKKNAIDLEVRFDIISIIGHGANSHIEHIKEAFIPPIWN